MYKTCEELRRAISTYTAELEEKFSGGDGKTYLMLCGGTGCIAGGTMDIRGELEKSIAAHHMEDKIAIRVVGCFGLCSEGPFVRVFPDDVLYRTVTPEDAEAIIQGIRDGEIIERLIYEDPRTGKK